MYCYTCSHLLNQNHGASARYLGAITALVKVAGKNEPELFHDAKSYCEACLTECKRTAKAVREHKAEHDDEDSDTQRSAQRIRNNRQPGAEYLRLDSA